MIRTPEQEAICSAVGAGDNVHVEALAGCAKSTTIIEALSEIPATRSVAILAFNAKIKKEMESKIKDASLARDNVKVLTMNGLGHNAISRALGKRLELDNDKVYKLSKEVGLQRRDMADVMQLVRSARMAGVIPTGLVGTPLLPDTAETWADLAMAEDIDPILTAPAKEVLRKSTKLALAGTIDFDDQLYVSTLIFGSYPRFDVVFVDEAQDLSVMNHRQVAKAAAGQIIAVGDSHQAIYAWRGADSHSMANIKELRPSWTTRTLSVTFRCPQIVVERQRSLVPNFTAAPTNVLGSISSLKEWAPTQAGSTSAVLCRNNAPLLRLAFSCLRAHIPVNFLGKDIGASLKRLYNKVSNHGKRDLDAVCADLEESALRDPDKADKYESLLIVLQSSSSVEDALSFLTESRHSAVSLATGHKAKGMEWDRVYHLDPFLIPSKHVTEMEEGEKRTALLTQEANLRYVIETRTKDELIMVSSKGLSL